MDKALSISQDGKHPSQEVIRTFFSYSPAEQHPFLSPKFQETLDLYTHSRLTNGNQVSLLPNDQSIALKIDLIRNATQSIHIATFQIVCDEGGKNFTRELIKAAARGIDVRFIVTGGPWTWGFSGNCPSLMRRGKVKVATMPYSYITNHGVVQLHDKLMIVDSQTSITGGQNIGSWYSKKNGQDGNFRDTDIMVSGDVVGDIEARFSVLWSIASPTNPMKSPELKTDRNKYAFWLSQKPLKGLCRFVTQTPSEKEFFVFEAYRQYALNSKQRFIFHSQALNAFGSAEQENLWEAILRISSHAHGQVYLITNGPGFYESHLMPSWAGSLVGYYFLNSVYTSLKDTNIQAFLYPSWLHSKVYLFDNLAVGIGSFNFDETGLVWTESTLICLDDRITKQVISMFETDLGDSYMIQTP